MDVLRGASAERSIRSDVQTRAPVEFPIDSEGVGIIMWLPADIRAELVAIHLLLEGGDDGEEGEEDS
jgi:hypothetical protein